MFAYILSRIKRKVPAQWVPKPSKPPLTEDQIAEALSLFRRHVPAFWREFSQMMGGLKVIPPVKCPTKFGGWGYVEGRTYGVIVDSRITIVEADEDMGFTEVCVLIDDLPCLLVQEGYHSFQGKSGLSITVISGRGYLDEMLNPSSQWSSTLKGFNRLQPPVRAIMLKILEVIYDANYKRETSQPRREVDAIEKILDYGMRK